MRCKDCEFLYIPEDNAEAFCTARSKRGRAISWSYGFEDLAIRKERVQKRLERDVKEPPWCFKRSKLHIINIKELKDCENLVFRNVNGRWCAYLVKETFAGYLDEEENEENKISCGFEVRR